MMSKIKEWIGYDYKPIDEAVPYMIQELVDHEMYTMTLDEAKQRVEDSVRAYYHAQSTDLVIHKHKKVFSHE
jgi:type VI protein secretion system component Hcp